MDNSREKIDDSQKTSEEVLEETLLMPDMMKTMNRLVKEKMDSMGIEEKIACVMSVSSDLNLTMSELLAGLFAYMEYLRKKEEITLKQLEKFIETVDMLKENLKTKE